MTSKSKLDVIWIYLFFVCLKINSYLRAQISTACRYKLSTGQVTDKRKTITAISKSVVRAGKPHTI